MYHDISSLDRAHWPELRFIAVKNSPNRGLVATFMQADGPNSCTAYELDRYELAELRRSAEADGQSLPYVQLAQHALNRAHLAPTIKFGIMRAGQYAGNAVLGLLAFAMAVTCAGFAQNRLLSSMHDDNDDRDLAAAKPLAVQSDVSYNAETRTAYKKDAGNLLVKWVFNENGQLSNACILTVRPADDIMGAWGGRKYQGKCFCAEDAIPSFLMPTFKLPQP